MFLDMLMLNYIAVDKWWMKAKAYQFWKLTYFLITGSVCVKDSNFCLALKN